MQRPVHISFHDVPSSPVLEARIRELAAHLERFDDHITSCHVTVQAPSGHHRHGEPYSVRIRLHVRGTEIVISRESAQNSAHADLQAALRDAFAAAARKLQSHVQRQEQHRSSN